MNIFAGCLLLISAVLISNVCCVNDKYNKVPARCTEPLFKCWTDCRKYMVCHHGKLIKVACPKGLYWNDVIKACDFDKPDDCEIPEGSDEEEEVTTIIPERINPSRKPWVKPTQTPKPTEKPAPSPRPIVKTTGPPSTEKLKVICYFSNLVSHEPIKFQPGDVIPELCTHVTYSFSILDSETLKIESAKKWTDIDAKFYENVVALKQHGIKVLISLNAMNDAAGDKYGRLLQDDQARSSFIESIVVFIQKHNFDGLDLNLEYPTCVKRSCKLVRPAQKQGFTQLAKELSEEFKVHNWILSAAASAKPEIVDSSYDVPQLAKYFEFISLMTFDYHTGSDSTTGHNAPLYSSDKLNVDYSVNYWIKKGAPSHKLVLGIPSFAHTFNLTNPENHGVNAPASGLGLEGPFTMTAESMAYYEICEKTKAGEWNVVRDPENNAGPYAYYDNQWISYEDVETVQAKSKYIRAMRLAGGMLWSLDFDDFTRRCGCGFYPLLTALHQKMQLQGGRPLHNCT